jgi:hypothetical protein
MPRRLSRNAHRQDRPFDFLRRSLRHHVDCSARYFGAEPLSAPT